MVFIFNIHLTQEPCFSPCLVALGSGNGFPVLCCKGRKKLTFGLFSFAVSPFTFSLFVLVFLHTPTVFFQLYTCEPKSMKKAQVSTGTSAFLDGKAPLQCCNEGSCLLSICPSTLYPHHNAFCMEPRHQQR